MEPSGLYISQDTIVLVVVTVLAAIGATLVGLRVWQSGHEKECNQRQVQNAASFKRFDGRLDTQDLKLEAIHREQRSQHEEIIGHLSAMSGRPRRSTDRGGTDD